MKPSKIIEDKTIKFMTIKGLMNTPVAIKDIVPIQIQSILDYLDEEYEKKHCDHNWEGVYGAVTLSCCKKCKKIEG